jgi:hypothetical protein
VVALVSDGQGRPFTGATVAFAFGDGTDATVAPDTAITGTNGEAAFQVVMGTHVGVIGAEVRVVSSSRTLSAPVSLRAVSADANGLTAVSGDGQSALVGAELADPLVVRVTDGFGNPIPGVDIAWTVDAGGAVSDETTPTGSDGLASVRRTLGPSAGIQHTLASAPGLAGSPVEFSHTATAGSATVLEPISGDGQSALVGTSLADPLVVRAHDASGNPVAGLAVAWVVGEGGGSLAPATSVTGGDGLASTRWTLGAAPGRNSATAVVSGVGTVAFTATGDPGTPPGLTLEVQPPATAVRGVVLSGRPVVQLREPDGSVRRRSGVSVRVALLPGGAIIRGTLTRATDAEGQAEFRDLSLEGPAGQYALAFSATGYTGVTSGTIALARAGTTTAILSDDPDPSTAGAAVRVRFRVQSPGGTPGGTVQVTSDDGASCSAPVSAGECTLALSAAGTRTLTAVYAGSAEFEGSADTEQHTVAAPEPARTTTRITADDPDPSDIGQAVTVGFSVTASSGTPTGTVTVTASGGGETCSASVAAGTCALTLTAAGDRKLTATYAGDGGFAGSSDTEDHTVRTPPAVPSATASSVEVKDATPALNHNTEVKVVVRDGSGNELEGITVTLSASGGGNTISPASKTTSKGGEAKFDFRSSEAGTKTITAVAGGVTLAQQPTISVELAHTQIGITSDAPDPSPPGVPVIVGFAVQSDAGSPTGTVTVSASSGESCTGAAPVGSCSLVPATAGTVTLTASYSGGGNFAPSSAQTDHDVAVPPPPLVSLHTQPAATAAPGIPFDRQPEVQLRNADGSELKLEGVTVIAELASGVGTLSGTVSRATDGDGRVAYDDLYIDGVPGSYTIRFSAAGYTPVESDPIVLELVVTKTEILSDGPDPSTVGEPVLVQFRVDANGGTPTGTVTIGSDGGESCTAAVADGGCSISFSSAGDFTLTAAYAGDETFAASTSDPKPHSVSEPEPPPGEVRAAAASPTRAPGV